MLGRFKINNITPEIYYKSREKTTGINT